MGFFGKLIGAPDADIMASPLIGRGDVVDVKVGRVGVGGGMHHGSMTAQKCEVTLRVLIDHTPAYQAVVSQLIPRANLAAMVPGSVAVAVRVDQKDHSRVAIDWDIPLPVITLARLEGRASLAWVLANGRPITLVILSSTPASLRSPDGDDVHFITVTVTGGVPTPYQAQIANPVPTSALPLLYPGSKLHAMLGDDPNRMIIDWSKGPLTAG